MDDGEGDGTGVVRRQLLHAACLSVGGGLAGCLGDGTATTQTKTGCVADTRAGLGYDVVPVELAERDDGGWRVTCDIVVHFEYAHPNTGLHETSLVAFGPNSDPTERTPLGDLTLAAVPDDERWQKTVCGTTATYGRLERTATVRPDRFPQWLGLRYERATAPIYYVGAEVPAYESASIPPEKPSVDDYRSAHIDSPASDAGVVPPFGVVEPEQTTERDETAARIEDRR